MIMQDELQFRQLRPGEKADEATALIREYLEWLNERIRRDYGIEFDVEAMIESDVSDPVKFYPPSGRFYLVRCRGEPAGVGCLKKLENGVGEVQRMYVPPAFRGSGIGRAIAARLIEDARSLGYRRLRLESLKFLGAAHALYRSLGFKDTAPYPGNSMESYQRSEQLDRYYSITVFMEMEL